MLTCLIFVQSFLLFFCLFKYWSFDWEKKNYIYIQTTIIWYGPSLVVLSGVESGMEHGLPVIDVVIGRISVEEGLDDLDAGRQIRRVGEREEAQVIAQFDAERELAQRRQQRDETGRGAAPILAPDQVAHSVDVLQEEEVIQRLEQVGCRATRRHQSVHAPDDSALASAAVNQVQDHLGKSPTQQSSSSLIIIDYNGSVYLENRRLNGVGQRDNERVGFLEASAEHGLKERHLEAVLDAAHQLIGSQLEKDVLLNSAHLTRLVVEHVAEDRLRANHVVHFQERS